MKMMKNAVEEKAYENQEAYQRTQMQKDMILERLREQGCRITRQRQLILDIILEEECSCCKEIYYKVQEKDRNIGPATIYRMVNMLSLIHIFDHSGSGSDHVGNQFDSDFRETASFSFEIPAS